LSSSACGLDPAKLPTTRLYADDGVSVESADALHFAVVGATRSAVTGKGDPVPAQQVIADLRAQKPIQDLKFAVLTGGQVARSATSEWTGFGDRWSAILDNSVPSENKSRLPAIALPGHGEALGDATLTGLGAAFPGTGADIGHGRVASWSRVDARVGDTVWRLVFLDAHRKQLGSRWEEELYWLPAQVSGDDFDHLLLFVNEPRFTTANGWHIGGDTGTAELLEVVDAHADVMKLTAVFAGGPATNEVYLPGGAFGELHVVAGNSGVPGDTFARGASPIAAGLDEPLLLDESFGRVLLASASDAARELELSDKFREQLNGAEGVAPRFPSDWATVGWWSVELRPGAMSATFRERAWDGSFSAHYRADWSRRGGWSSTTW